MRRIVLRLTYMALAAGVVPGCGSDDPGGGGMAPPAPTVDAPATPTRLDPITLTGHGVSGATIQVRGGSSGVATGTAGSDGAFSLPVALRHDTASTLLVSQSVGGVEGTAASVVVTHDGTAPMTPVLDAVITPTRRTMQQIRGRAEARGMVRISGGTADVMGPVDAMGRFDVAVTLRTAAMGTTANMLSVVALDAAGNESGPAMATIVHNPDLPVEAPALDAVQSPTNDDPIMLSGSAEPSVHITVAGGVSPASGDADATGHFSVAVSLRHDVENVLTVFAVAPATGLSSAGVTVSVVHDDIAPDSPALDPTSSPTGAEAVTLTGRSEAGATIAVTGGAAAASATADAAGTFSVVVMLTRDASNELSIVATDVAGNPSAPQSMTIVQDSSLPVPIAVDPPASPTRDSPVTLSGRTESGAAVTVMGGAAPAVATAAADGSFSVAVMLTPNARNELHITRAGATVETIVVVVHDSVAPAAPTLNTIASPTSRTDLDVAGASEAAASISVTGGVAPASGAAGPDGRFSVRVTIASDAASTLSVVATDRAGNTSSAATTMVTHSSSVPDAPVLDTPAPPPTSSATYTMSGHVAAPAAGVTVRITGGAADATGPTDPATGVFAVDVTLTPNAINELHVVSINGAITSPEAIATITHDDIAPAAPVSASITVASPPALVTCPVRTALAVTGAMSSVEAGSTVRVRNMASAASVSATATAGGSFSTSLAACRGEILSIVAVDAAGNASASTEKTVM